MNRTEEIGVYEKAYTDPKYRMGVRRKSDVRKIIAGLEKGSFLDIGAGRGESLEMAIHAGHSPVAGTDVVPALLGERMVYAEAHNLPFPDGEYDYVTCFDVLEHLVEEDIRPCLKEMYRVARKSCIVSASERNSIYKGRELHISRRPKAKWMRLIAECWPGAYEFGNAGASPCFRVDK